MKSLNKLKIILIATTLLFFFGGVFVFFIILPSPEFAVLKMDFHYQRSDSQSILEMLDPDFFKKQVQTEEVVDEDDYSKQIIKENFVNQIEEQELYRTNQSLFRQIITGQRIERVENNFKIGLFNRSGNIVFIGFEKQEDRWKITDIQASGIINLLRDDSIKKLNKEDRFIINDFEYRVIKNHFLTDESGLDLNLPSNNLEIKPTNKFYKITLEITPINSPETTPFELNQVYLVNKNGRVILPTNTGLERSETEKNRQNQENQDLNFTSDIKKSVENQETFHLNFFFDTSQESLEESWLLVGGEIIELNN